MSTPLIISVRCSNAIHALDIKPLIVFENLHNADKKSVIYKALQSIAGVYIIINLTNNDTYVGSAITGRIYTRFYKHLISYDGNKHVAAAVKKYGLDNFAFVVVSVVPPVISSMDNVELIAEENRFIQAVKPKYNVAPIAGNTFGVKHTDETKNKMRENYSDKRRTFIGNLNKGKSLSKSTRAKLREKALNRLPISEEVRKLVSLNSTVALIYGVYNIDSDNNVDYNNVFELRGLIAVAKHCNCNMRTVTRALSSNGIVKRKFFVKVLRKAKGNLFY